jgi:integrase
MVAPVEFSNTGHFKALRSTMRYKPAMGRKNYELDQSKFLSTDEWEGLEIILRQELGSPKPARERNGLLLLLSFRTGARAGEILAIRRSDFFERDRKILIRGTKGSKNREIVLPQYLARHLGSYLTRNPELDVIFPISYHRLRQIWDWYRPAAKKFHSLRHTFALETFRKTHNIHLVQMALGHRSIQNTMIYVEYYYSTLELKKAIF